MGDDDDLMMWAGLYHLYLTSLPIRYLRSCLELQTNFVAK